MKKILTGMCLLAGLSFVSQANAQQHLTINGQAVEKAVASLVFDGDEVVLTFQDQTQQRADMAAVVLTLGSDATGIDALSVYESGVLVDGKLTIGQLPENTEVALYDASGKLMHRTRSSQIDMSQMKAGVYVLKAGQQIVKFVKR